MIIHHFIRSHTILKSFNTITNNLKTKAYIGFVTILSIILSIKLLFLDPMRKAREVLMKVSNQGGFFTG